MVLMVHLHRQAAHRLAEASWRSEALKLLQTTAGASGILWSALWRTMPRRKWSGMRA